jgi:hypothetical protein
MVSSLIWLSECGHGQASNSRSRPEHGCLAAPAGIAKSKIRAGSGVPWKNSQADVTGGHPGSSGAQEAPMQRWIAAILAVFNVTNGLVMLFASSIWWAHVAGARDTGPFNPHFVQDVGAAFTVAGLALAARAWRPDYWPAAVAGVGFLAAHALIHLAMIATGDDRHAVEDLLAVIAPAALAVYAAFPAQGERQHA